MSRAKDHKSSADPLVDEVRGVRKALSETFDNDVEKLCDYLRHIEEQHQERVAKPVQDLPGSD